MFYVTNCRVMLSSPSFSECLSIYIQKSPLDFSEHKNFKANPQQHRHLRMPLKTLFQLTSRSLCTIVPSHHINALWSLSIFYFLKNSTESERQKILFFIIQYHWVKSHFQASAAGLSWKALMHYFSLAILFQKEEK